MAKKGKLSLKTSLIISARYESVQYSGIPYQHNACLTFIQEQYRTTYGSQLFKDPEFLLYFSTQNKSLNDI